MPSPTSLSLWHRITQEMTFETNVTRQQAAQKLIDYYDGKQLEYLDTVLASQFSDPAALKLQPAIDNITRFVTDEISRVFDEAPMLTTDDVNGQALLDQFKNDGLLDITLKTAEVYSNLTGIAALHPWYDQKTQTIKTTLIPSSALFVAQRTDDPTEAEAVVYARQLIDTITAESKIEYVHWDDESCFLFSQDQMGVYRPPSPDNPEMINPYGVIPFAFIRDSLPVGQFFPTIDETLANSQENLNVLITALNQLAKYQGFSQPVMIGEFDPKNPIEVDPSKPIKIPRSTDGEQASSFNFVSPPSHINEIISQISDLIQRTISRKGIASNALKDSQSASGYALKIQNQRLDRKRVDSIPLCRHALLRWWDIVKRINNAHNTKKINPEATIKIDFVEPSYQESATTQVDVDERRIKLGLDNPISIIMRDNPDLTEEEAKKKYEQNLSFSKIVTDNSNDNNSDDSGNQDDNV